MRIVLDTNVLISSLITLGAPRELLRRILRREATLVISREILNEFMRVMRRKKFAEYATEEQVQKFVERIESVADLVELKSHTRIVAQDPKDDVVVNTAVDAEADYVLTGDRHLLDLKEFRGIRIVSVDEALREIKKR